MQNFHKLLLFSILFILIFSSGCDVKSAKESSPPAPLPHLRYFESSALEDGKKLFTLYDYDIAFSTKREIWSLADFNIDRVEITPDGNYVLVHYSVYEELSQYYVIYNLAGRMSGEPMTFYRNETETLKVSAYEAYLGFGTYNYGFIIGDPDFKALEAKVEPDVYQFAWVSLIAGVVEDIPLVTTTFEIPDIIYLPEQGGYFDFIKKGEADILRLTWDTLEISFMHQLIDREKEPLRQIQYIGSFNYFADFQLPPRSKMMQEPMKVGIRSKQNIFALEPGDFPLWSLQDRYILLRVFPGDTVDRMITGQDILQTLMEIKKSGKPAEFAIFDTEIEERRDISLETVNPIATPHPPFDPSSNLIAVEDMGWSPVGESPSTETPDETKTRTIIIFDIANDETAATIEGIPTVEDTTMAFHRPG